MGSISPPDRSLSIERMGRDDAARVVAAQHLFDGPARPDAVAGFLAEPTHHLLIAYSDGVPAGFVSGVEVTHPDKGTEMFLYELAVDEAHRQQGIGTALVRELERLARAQGCYGMWVLVDHDNAVAAATYRKAGGELESRPLMFAWAFE